MKEKSNLEFKYKVIGFFITIGLIILLYNCIFGNTEENKNKEPDEIELMTYAQMVLNDNLQNPKYSSYKGDYEFIGTGLRRNSKQPKILYDYRIFR